MNVCMCTRVSYKTYERVDNSVNNVFTQIDFKTKKIRLLGTNKMLFPVNLYCESRFFDKKKKKYFIFST